MPMKFPAIEVLVNVAEYTVKDISANQQQIDDYLAQKEILIGKIKKSKEILVDAKPLIISIEKVADNGLKILLRFGQNKNLKFGAILQNLLKLQEDRIKILHVERKKLCIEKNENIYEI
jgi:hypothetical protein